MKRIFLLFSLAFSSAHAQQLLPIQHDTNFVQHEIIFSGVADYGATSVANEMANRFFYGGEITNDVKQTSYDHHKGINRLGLDMKGELEYRNMTGGFLGKENLGWIVKAGYFNFSSMLYSKDLFGLAFFGNERYLGTEATFSGSRFSNWSYQKIGFGIIDRKSKSNLCLNLFGINSYSNAIVRDGVLFQSVDGDSLSLRMDGEMNSAGGSSYFKGFGLGIDADVRIPVEIKKDKISYIQFSAKNVGIAFLHSPVTKYSADTLITYNGLTFDQLYGEGSLFNGNLSFRDTLGIDSLSWTGVRFLPGYLQVGKIVSELDPSRYQSFFGIRLYPTVSFTPMVYAGLHFRIVKWLDAGVNISYGGFSGFRAGMYSQVNFNRFKLGIATEDLYGSLSKNGFGQSLMIRLRCAF